MPRSPSSHANAVAQTTKSNQNPAYAQSHHKPSNWHYSSQTATCASVPNSDSSAQSAHASAHPSPPPHPAQPPSPTRSYTMAVWPPQIVQTREDQRVVVDHPGVLSATRRAPVELLDVSHRVLCTAICRLIASRALPIYCCVSRWTRPPTRTGVPGVSVIVHRELRATHLNRSIDPERRYRKSHD